MMKTDKHSSIHLLVLLVSFACFSWSINSVTASGGSPFYNHRWGVAGMRSSPLTTLRSTDGGRIHSLETTKDFSRLRAKNAALRLLEEDEEEENNLNSAKAVLGQLPPRGGQDADAFVKAVGSVTQILVQCGKLVLPPTAAFVKLIVDVYRALPKDAIVAQVGLVYCFAGGYYPTLFSSLQAAQHCGWNIMVDAITDLTDEAIAVIHALEDAQVSKFGFEDDDASAKRQKRKNKFRQNTSIVLATVDPMKINQAAGALYTTWLGVSSVGCADGCLFYLWALMSLFLHSSYIAFLFCHLCFIGLGT
jgi:hypothetical protein